MFHFKKLFAFTFISFLFHSILFAQVGVGTTTPKAAMDVASTNQGFLMPRIALSATNIPTLVNPNGGSLEVGTMVFNTANTAGTYGVKQGLYYWDGSYWVSNSHQYYKTNFTQTADVTVASGSSFTNITGLNARTFTAPYSGEYQIIFSGYLGTETVDDITTNLSSGRDVSGYAATGYVEGKFRLTINGASQDKYSYSVSYYRSSDAASGGGGTNIYQLFNQVTIITTVNLTAGSVCTLNAAYSGENDDNIGDAHPHVVGSMGPLGNECEINVTYLGR